MILTILNFSDGKVYQKDMTDEPMWSEEWGQEGYEEYMINKGFKLGNIEWMTSVDDEGLTPIENHG